jgi:hypothetical protein
VHRRDSALKKHSRRTHPELTSGDGGQIHWVKERMGVRLRRIDYVTVSGLDGVVTAILFFFFFFILLV